MFRVDRAVADDAEGIAAVARAAWLPAVDPANASALGFLVNVQPAEEYARRIAASDLCFAAKSDAGRVIGFLIAMSGAVLARMQGTIGGEDEVVRALLAWGPAAEFCFFDQVAVDPEWRGRGVAQRLYDAVAEACGARTYGCCILLEPVRNAASIGFFERNGWTLAEPVREGNCLWGLFRKDETAAAGTRLLSRTIMDNQRGRIDAADLLAISDRVRSALANLGMLEIASDYYWSLPPRARYDVTRFPAEPEAGIGQLSEDAEWLARLARNDAEILPNDLIYFGRILQAIGEGAISGGGGSAPWEASGGRHFIRRIR